MYQAFRAPALFLVTLAVSACGVEKSANPLSPAVAGPIPGVNITTPRLVEPAVGARIAVSAQPVTLTVENATSNGPRPLNYLFEVATDAQFTTKLVTRPDITPGANGRTSVTLPVLDTGKTYFWRALARDGANTGTYAAGASFSIFTAAAIEAPIAISPVNGAAVGILTPMLTFQNAVRTGSVGTVVYLLTINTAADLPVGSSLGFWWVEEQAGGLTSFLVPAGVLAGGRQYYWSVMSTDGTLGGNYSKVESFVTPATPAAAPGR